MRQILKTLKTALWWALLLAPLAAVGAGVRLAWDPPTTGPTPLGYRIYYGTASGVYGPTPISVGAVFTYDVPNLTPGTKYFFALKSADAATGGNQSAAFSNEVSATIPQVIQPPTIKTITILAATEVPQSLAQRDSISTLTTGVRVATAAPGTAKAVRFFKTPEDRGLHYVSIYDNRTGKNLTGKILSTGETASGWQRVKIADKALPPGSYTVTLESTRGWYVATENYFSSAYSVGPLNLAPGAGVYRYGRGLPTATWNQSNYFVDLEWEGAS